MKYQVFVLILIGLLCFSCKDEEEPDSSVFAFEADPAGAWYIGDFHVHSTGASNDTGGDSWPSNIKEIAVARGLDFVVLTDHSNSTGSDATTTDEDPLLFNMGPEFTYWDSAAILTDNNFLMVAGNEISPVNDDDNIPTGHFGCIPKVLASFDTEVVFIDRPFSAVTGGQALGQANDAGCFSILNHPYAITNWIAYDWSSYEYSAMEIWNGTIGFDAWDEKGRKAWLCDLLAGRMVTPIGASDCHRVYKPPPGNLNHPALGYPSTAVFASNYSWDAIIDGLEAGLVSIFEGNSRLYMDSYDERGVREEGDQISILRLRGSVDENLIEPTLTVYRSFACADNRPSSIDEVALTEEILYSEVMEAGTDFDVRLDIAGAAGVYHAKLSKPDGLGHYLAFSKAIVID